MNDEPINLAQARASDTTKEVTVNAELVLQLPDADTARSVVAQWCYGMPGLMHLHLGQVTTHTKDEGEEP